MPDEELKAETPNWGVDKSEDDLSFPSKPPIESRPDGSQVENRPGALAGPGYVNRTYAISGRQIMQVCGMIDRGHTDAAIAALSDLPDVTDMSLVDDHRGEGTIGAKVRAELDREGDGEHGVDH